MYKVLVTGAKGQLGTEFFKSQDKAPSNFQFFFADSLELDITKSSDIEEYVLTNGIGVIINCAAYTNVEKAQDSKQHAYEVNAYAVKNLVEISKKYNVKLVHISTDYVFDGKNYLPYNEEQIVHPINIYGASKRKGEEIILLSGITNSLIIRTSWVYAAHGHNFVNTMLRLSETKGELSVVFDQIGAPTYTLDLVKAILHIIPQLEQHERTEVYHYSNAGVCSWYDFAEAIFDIKGIDIKVDPVASDKFPTKAARPFYSVLSKKKIQSIFGVDVPYWRTSLKQCLEQ